MTQLNVSFNYSSEAECKESLRQDTSLSADTASARELLEITSLLPCTEETYFEAILEDTGASRGLRTRVVSAGVFVSYLR